MTPPKPKISKPFPDTRGPSGEQWAITVKRGNLVDVHRFPTKEDAAEFKRRYGKPTHSGRKRKTTLLISDGGLR